MGGMLATETDPVVQQAQRLNAITPQLLEALRGGSHGAYQEIYLRHWGPVRDYLATLLRSEHDADEIAQNVFMALWEKRGQIDPGRNILGYIYKMAHNNALKHIRDKRPEVNYHDLAELALVNVEHADSGMLAREKELLVRVVMERMPSMRRKVFELHHYAGLTNEQIADRLGISRSNVAAHLAHARRDMKEVKELLAIMVAMLLAG